MRYNIGKITIMLLLLFFCRISLAEPEEQPSKEYHVKAAFIHNFIKFIEWPEEKTEDTNEPIIIGVLGESPIYQSLKKIKFKKIRKKEVEIKYFKSLTGLDLSESEREQNSELQKKLEELGNCHTLFVSKSEKNYFRKLTDLFEKNNVLTIDSHPEFLQSAGIINFVIKDNKVRFEVNTTAANRTKLEISSKLLRLALNIVEKDYKSVNPEQKNRDKS